MKTHLVTIITTFCALLIPLSAQQPSAQMPPVGVPADATLFNGKWYKLYLEKTPWKTAKAKCERLGGQLAVIPDAPTNVFIQQLSDNRSLWIGAYEKVEGLWMWVDGTPMKFKAWARGEPDDSAHMLNVLIMWKNAWWDDEGKGAIGYICEWKAK